MNQECTPRCIKCGSARHVRTSGTTPRAFYCAKCGIEFEDIDDGDVGRGRPDRIAIRREEYAIRERERRARR
jgi:hypothetical protein